MKDIQFTVKQQKREIYYILACLLLAVLFNVFAIISYDTEWKELYTQWFTVILLAIIFYFLVTICRLIFWLISEKFISTKL